jgi:hypothetical protein
MLVAAETHCLAGLVLARFRQFEPALRLAAAVIVGATKPIRPLLPLPWNF